MGKDGLDASGDGLAQQRGPTKKGTAYTVPFFHIIRSKSYANVRVISSRSKISITSFGLMSS